MSSNNNDSDRDASLTGSGSSAEKSSTIPGGRSFADTNIAGDEESQARGRRESAASRDNTALGPHDQEFSEGTAPRRATSQDLENLDE